MRLHVGAVEVRGPADMTGLGEGSEDAPPDAAPAPAVPAVVDRRVGTIVLRRVAPPPARLEHVDDTADDAAIVDPPRAGWFFGSSGSSIAQASSDNQNKKGDIERAPESEALYESPNGLPINRVIGYRP